MATTTDLVYARDRLAYYKAMKPHKVMGRTFTWHEEITFWQKEVNELEKQDGN